MKLYDHYAEWWPLLSPPEEYQEEAGLFWEIISRNKNDIKIALELGSGGGSNAFHLKKYCHWTLADISSEMLKVSHNLNPECEHIAGDMRTLDLGRTFDLVFIHDAISLITNLEDLRMVIKVAKQHLRDGGLLFIAPDYFQETYQSDSDCGGYDKDGKGLRYLEWSHDENPKDHLVQVEYVYVFKDEDGVITTDHESTVNNAFPMKLWKSLIEELDFSVAFEQVHHSDVSDMKYYAIVAKKL